VGESAEGAETAVKEFVNAFNAFVEALNSSTSFNAETGQAGILLGDSTVRQMESRLRSALSDRVPGVAGGPDSLASLGIRTRDDGLLSIDGERLSAALAENPGGVEALFTGEEGLAARVGGVISGYVGTNGLLDTRTDGLNARIEDIGDQRIRLGERIEALEERLRAQFTAMDQLVAELQTTGNFLAEQLGALNNNRNDR
jgi:flagellar hook-associated protein 2